MKRYCNKCGIVLKFLERLEETESSENMFSDIFCPLNIAFV